MGQSIDQLLAVIEKDRAASKLCTKCGRRKPLTEFFKNRAKKDGHQPYCKRCYAGIQRTHYAKSDRRKTRVREQKQVAVARNLKYARNYLRRHPCACGQSDLTVLTFYRTVADGPTVSMLIYGGYSLARIRAEIKRCHVVCANCRRRNHYPGY